MIAANYRRHPQAMALQLVLHFGPTRWATSRPTTRIGRAIRAARGAAFKLAGFIRYPEKPTTPQWVKDAARKARNLAKAVKAALMHLPLNDPTDAIGIACAGMRRGSRRGHALTGCPPERHHWITATVERFGRAPDW